MSRVLRTPPVEARAYYLRPPDTRDDERLARYSDRELREALAGAAGSAEAKVRSETEATLRELADRTGRAIDGFAAIARELAAARQGIFESAAREVVELAVLIAERIVRREIELDPEVALRASRELLQRAAAGSQVVVRLAPADLALAQERLGGLAEASGLDGVRLRVDPALSPGGCVVETDAGSLDARVETQLERIREALLPALEEAA